MVTYKIHLSKLTENYKAFSKYGDVYFPIKTNHNPIILNHLKSLGCGFETDSLSHIKKVYTKKIANKIMFSNVAKSYADIKWAIIHKITYYTIDDVETLKTIIDLAIKYKLSKLKINVRLNVYECFREVFDKKGAIDSRLGALVVVAKNLLDIINNEKRIKIEKGVSFYIQAEIHNDQDCIIKMLNHISNNFDRASHIDFINIGGGADIERLDYSMSAIKNSLDYLGAKYIVLEPGRYLVGNVEDLYIPCIRVVDNKKITNEILASLSIGIYHGLIDISLHKRLFEIYVLNNNQLVPLVRYTGNGTRLVLRGQTADSLDFLGIYELPPCDINSNTIFVIKNVGAYVEVLNSEFSGKIKQQFIKEIT